MTQMPRVFHPKTELSSGAKYPDPASLHLIANYPWPGCNDLNCMATADRNSLINDRANIGLHFLPYPCVEKNCMIGLDQGVWGVGTAYSPTPPITMNPTASPTDAPTAAPTPNATAAPTATPTAAPTAVNDTNVPTPAPTASPTDAPTAHPTMSRATAR